MLCKNCKFYTGVLCHGHGEFWGECKLINLLCSELEENIDKKDEEIEVALSKIGCKKDFINKVSFSHFDYICNDDSSCKFKKFVDDMYFRGIINNKMFKDLSNKDVYKGCLNSNSFFDAFSDICKTVCDDIGRAIEDSFYEK